MLSLAGFSRRIFAVDSIKVPASVYENFLVFTVCVHLLIEVNCEERTDLFEYK